MGYTIRDREETAPEAFSHISHKGTARVSASSIRTCLLARLLHAWTFIPTEDVLLGFHPTEDV